MPWCSGYQYCTQLHEIKPILKFCTGSNLTRSVSEISNGENLWQWSRFEIKLNVFRRSTSFLRIWSQLLKILSIKLHFLCSGNETTIIIVIQKQGSRDLSKHLFQFMFPLYQKEISVSKTWSKKRMIIIIFIDLKFLRC